MQTVHPTSEVRRGQLLRPAARRECSQNKRTHHRSTPESRRWSHPANRRKCTRLWEFGLSTQAEVLPVHRVPRVVNLDGSGPWALCFRPGWDGKKSLGVSHWASRHPAELSRDVPGDARAAGRSGRGRSRGHAQTVHGVSGYGAVAHHRRPRHAQAAGHHGRGLGKLLGDAAAATAMLDRILHHGHVLKCGPRSWRTKLAAGAEKWAIENEKVFL